jgi:hypothetical protein
MLRLRCVPPPPLAGRGFWGVVSRQARAVGTIDAIQKATMIHEEAEPLALPESSRTNADDRLPLASLGRVEGGDGFIEGRDVADVRPQSSVPHPLDDLSQLGPI